MAEMLYFLSPGKGRYYLLQIIFCQAVVVSDLDTFLGGVNEYSSVVGFALFQNHDAGGYACAKEQVGWQLDDAIHKVVIKQVLADFLLGTATIHDAWEANDGRCAVWCKP